MAKTISIVEARKRFAETADTKEWFEAFAEQFHDDLSALASQ